MSNAPVLHTAERDISSGLKLSFTILIILVSVLGFGGTLSNTLSLSYFLKQDRTTLASRLMILLNSIDLLVCVSALVLWAVIMVFSFTAAGQGSDMSVLVYFGAWFRLLVESTAFATCLLSVNRTLSIVYPFYKTSFRTVVFFTILFNISLVFSTFFLLNLPWLDVTGIIILNVTKLFLIILVVGISSVICVIKLRKRDRNFSKNNRNFNKSSSSSSGARHATITILIISGCFCVINIAYLAAILVGWMTDSQQDFVVFGLFSAYVGVPFNSTINPIIYFIRKKQMRDYISSIFRCNGRIRAQADKGMCPESGETRTEPM